MRALFIHGRFPGPFRFIAQALAALPGAKVLFLAERGRHEVRLPKVRRLVVPLAAPAVTQGEPTASQADECRRRRETAEQETAAILRHASATANVLLRLKNEGFAPDLVYASPSGGHSLYARDIFPEALHVAYANWFHAHDANFAFFHRDSPRSPVDFAPARIQNLLQYNALMESQLVVTSTCWQRDHYPPALAERIQVRPEGVDTVFFFPAPASPSAHGDEVLTFVWSLPSAFAGAPQFMACLPRVLDARPGCRVVILALHENARQEAENALQTLPESQRNRVRPTLVADREAVRAELQASSVHVYLTPPFTLVSLLAEAMSCGCLVVASDTTPVREFITHGQEGLLTDFWNSEALADLAIRTLERRHSPQAHAMRAAARQVMLDSHDARACTERHLHLLFDALRSHKKG